ncbi:response regulator transcription factor [Streptomyces sp. NPDC003710]
MGRETGPADRSPWGPASCQARRQRCTERTLTRRSSCGYLTQPAYCDDHISSALNDITPRRSVTPSEREVLALMCRGLSNTELAAALTLSEATVKTRVAGIFAKLALRDRAQALVLAYETGLVTPGCSATE